MISNIYPNKPRILGLRFNPKGYPIVRLKCLDGKFKTVTVHRLVATHYIPNEENHPQINHKDGVKTNNNELNLEWVSPVQNMRHASDNNLLTSHNSMAVACLETGMTWSSINKAAKHFKIPCGSLWKKLKGKRKNNTSLVLIDHGVGFEPTNN